MGCVFRALYVYICTQQLIVHIYIRSIGFAQHRFIVSLVYRSVLSVVIAVLIIDIIL